MKYLIPFLLASLMNVAMAKEVSYKVTFKANFTKAAHPGSGFPNNPHFSPLIGASHNAAYSMYQVGSKATTGVKNVAETGNPTVLLSELSDLRSSDIVKDLQRGGGTSGTSSSTVTLQVSEDFPLISVITMIAPSPDWVVGVSGFSLIENGEFIKKRELPLYAIDAGTDGGTRYTSSNRKKSEPIGLLIDVSGNAIKNPFGTLTIEML
jgi:hypothetical protein